MSDIAWMEELHSFYVGQINGQILPFWQKAVDYERGGVFTGYDQMGVTLLHRDKFTWSQGRFLWLWSRLADRRRSGLLPLDTEGQDAGTAELVEARRTYLFLREHAFLEDGSCAFLLTEEGRQKEMTSGQGHDISIYADCFVAMGFAEYGRVAGDPEAIRTAERMLAHIEHRLEAGTARTEPYPVPDGFDAHGLAMIMLNASQVIAGALESMGGTSSAPNEYRRLAWRYTKRILDTFCDDRDRVREIVRRGHKAEEDEELLLLRHLNPGHTVESMWFVMEEAVRNDSAETIVKAARILIRALTTGWDYEYGGLFRYVDMDGGEPSGKSMPRDDPFERLIRQTWDTKLWWPHSEALYACLLAYKLTGDGIHREWYRRLHRYTFDVFPAAQGKEWLQVRNREGQPIEKVVALPVKDPYHILRNMLLIVDLISGTCPQDPSQ